MAYYAVFIVLTIYLSCILGFNDFEASMISGLFSGGLYLLPIFSAAYADKIGFRKSMIIAFSLLSIGYLGLVYCPLYWKLPVWLVMVPLLNLMVCLIAIPVDHRAGFVCTYGGGLSSIKSISASVAKETTEATRARGYSRYQMTACGAFTLKRLSILCVMSLVNKRISILIISPVR